MQVMSNIDGGGGSNNTESINSNNNYFNIKSNKNDILDNFNKAVAAGSQNTGGTNTSSNSSPFDNIRNAVTELGQNIGEKVSTAKSTIETGTTPSTSLFQNDAYSQKHIQDTFTEITGVEVPNNKFDENVYPANRPNEQHNADNNPPFNSGNVSNDTTLNTQEPFNNGQVQSGRDYASSPDDGYNIYNQYNSGESYYFPNGGPIVGSTNGSTTTTGGTATYEIKNLATLEQSVSDLSTVNESVKRNTTNIENLLSQIKTNWENEAGADLASIIRELENCTTKLNAIIPVVSKYISTMNTLTQSTKTTQSNTI